MELLHERCAGLDVHKDTVVACVRLSTPRTKASAEVRTFSTITKGLLELGEWLTQQGVTHVAMESTGVYWKPVWHVLEGSFELVLGNANHMRNLPGRKSDVKDAEWISDLLAHGLIRESFVPPTAIQALRDLTRTRTQCARELARHIQRIQKTLEDANIKLASFLSDVLGKSGRTMLEAIIRGELEPARVAALADYRVQATSEELAEALRGQPTDHHRFLLRLHLDQIDHLDAAIHRLEDRIEDGLRPFRDVEARLKTVPGIRDRAVAVVVSELGVDVDRFPSPAHLVSWVGLCPQTHQSAGKIGSTRIRKGSPWLKALLVQCAWAAIRKPGYLRAQYHRIKNRRGPKKAIIAVAASMVTAIYYILRDAVTYSDLGADYFDKRDKAKLANRLRRRLAELGFEVELRETPPPPPAAEPAVSIGSSGGTVGALAIELATTAGRWRWRLAM